MRPLFSVIPSCRLHGDAVHRSAVCWPLYDFLLFDHIFFCDIRNAKPWLGVVHRGRVRSDVSRGLFHPSFIQLAVQPFFGHSRNEEIFKLNCPMEWKKIQVKMHFLRYSLVTCDKSICGKNLCNKLGWMLPRHQSFGFTELYRLTFYMHHFICIMLFILKTYGQNKNVFSRLSVRVMFFVSS